MKYDIRQAPQVTKKRTNVRLGDASFTKDTLASDIQVQSQSDIEYLLQAITLDETDRQIKIGNEPSRVVVDNRDTKPLDKAQRKSEVIFGSFLDRQIMRNVEAELVKNIGRFTKEHTGRLIDIKNYWEWVYAPSVGAPATRSLPRPLVMPFGAALILRPKIPYVALVNMWVARRGLPAGQRSGPNRAPELGFIGLTVATLRRKTLYKNFTITAGFSRDFPVKGELSEKQGTPFISVKAVTRGRRKVRRRMKTK